MISPFCSSSCFFAPLPAAKHAFHRSSDQWIDCVNCSDDLFNSSEVNCSILFSLYLLRMTKKMDYFLRNFVRRERESDSLVQHQSTFFHSSEWCSVNNQQVLSFVVSLLPLIGMQNPSPSVVTLVLQAYLQDFLCCCCLNQSQIYLFHEKFQPRSEYCLRSETKFLSRFHIDHASNWS